MGRLVSGLIKFRYAILILFGILTVFSLLIMQTVQVNYDLSEYLPENSMTKRAISAMKQEFGYYGMADVMVENLSISEALEIKNRIKNINGVRSVTWLDDAVDITIPLNMIDEAILKEFYKDRAALYRVEFSEEDYSLKTGNALDEIRALLGDDAIISGTAEDTRYMREVLNSEMLTIILIVVPLCVLVLLFESHSWIEPLLYLLVIGVSIAINMGTNIIFGRISFLTRAITAVLQLAISMDYSLFIFHRYTEERQAGKDIVTAIKTSIKKSISSVSASALTTIAGFLALLFMQYGIGRDLGLVLAKGIILSFICVIILMPILIYILSVIIDKSQHRPLVPSFQGLAKFVMRFRIPFIILLLIVIVPAFLAQSRNVFLYGETSGSGSQGENYENRQRIKERFGIYNPIMLLVPSDGINSEVDLAKELETSEYVRDVQALVTLADPSIPRSLIPQSVKDRFVSQNYSRFIILLNSDEETSESYAAVDRIKEAAQKCYPDKWLMAGKSSSIADIKESVEIDSRQVMFFSILAVGIIVLLTFKSLSIPVILVAVIQASIWINMSIPYFQGSSLVYIGYLVVSSLQLGATIDYAILLTTRYMEFRLTEKPIQAAILAVKTAGVSVVTSALILTIAGYSEGIISKIHAISTIGNLLGRGAALSALMVLLILPILLSLFDSVIMRTTLNTSRIINNDGKGD